MNYSLQQRLKDHLTARKLAGNLRRLTLAGNLADFCSNDYLGLARSKELQHRIELEMQRLTNGNPVHSNGATGSRLISGNNAYTCDTEKKLAAIFVSQSCLLFNSGYSANSAVLSCIPQKGDVILCDELIHASLREGTQLSYAQRFSFRHNDMAVLEKKLARPECRPTSEDGQVFIVAESVYSMDGDFAPLSELLDLCERYGAHLIWDEAHSTGAWGEGGNGLACTTGQQDRIFARIYTFGKAMGVHGACVAGSTVLTDYLTNFARSFIFTTAMPLHSVVSIHQSFDFLADNPSLQTVLAQKIQRFTGLLHHLKDRMIPSQSPIQILKVGGNEATRRVAESLQTAGFDVRPILSPTVKAGEERLRICLHAYNSDEELIDLVHLLEKELLIDEGKAL